MIIERISKIKALEKLTAEGCGLSKQSIKKIKDLMDNFFRNSTRKPPAKDEGEHYYSASDHFKNNTQDDAELFCFKQANKQIFERCIHALRSSPSNLVTIGITSSTEIKEILDKELPMVSAARDYSLVIYDNPTYILSSLSDSLKKENKDANYSFGTADTALIIFSMAKNMDCIYGETYAMDMFFPGGSSNV